MTITIELTEEQEARLRAAGITAENAETFATAAIEAALPQENGASAAASDKSRAEEIQERLRRRDQAEAAFAALAAQLPGEVPVLSHEALSREGIYAEHP